MLTMLQEKYRFCDGLSRRAFLEIGSSAVGGISLPAMLRAEEQQNSGNSKKSVIMVYLSGGLAHQDTFDLKPEAPDGIRGEFKPMDSSVPGVQVGELLPKMASVMDRVALVRSIVGLRDEHTSYQNITGYPMRMSRIEGRPNFGSVIGQLQDPSQSTIPAYVDMFPTMQHRPYNIPGPGFLGAQYRGVKADGEDLASMKLRYISGMRFTNRQQLLHQVNQYQRDRDHGAYDGMDSAYRRAFDVLMSSKLVDALDVEREDVKTLERYGRGSPKHLGDGAPMWNDQLLAARRLVESGVRCVTVAYGFWDTHGNNFGQLRERLPLFDQGISALIEDIYQRGLDRDVTVVVWGEFGRTPKINAGAGRDHWARVNGALLAGGRMRVGQVLGSTDKMAGEAKSRPVHYQDVLATVYHNLGIDPHAAVKDPAGRAFRILQPEARVIPELI